MVLCRRLLSFVAMISDSSTARDLMSASAQFNNAIRRLGDGWSLFIEAQRNAVSDYPESSWPSRAAELIDRERNKAFNQVGRYFSNDYFLTLVFKQPDQVSNRGGAWFLHKTDAKAIDQSQEFFTKDINEIYGLLSGLFPLFRELNDDETLTYLHSTVSSKRHLVKTPDMPLYLDHILSDESVEHGLELKLGDDFLRVLSIKAFPSESFPGMLDAINDLAFPFRWSSRFIAMGPDSAKAHRKYSPGLVCGP